MKGIPGGPRLLIMTGLAFALYMMVGVWLAPRTDVLASERSPDGRLEALLTESSSRGGSSAIFFLHLVPMNGSSSRVCVSMGSLRAPALRWDGPHRLVLSYASAEVWRYNPAVTLRDPAFPLFVEVALERRHGQRNANTR